MSPYAVTVIIKYHLNIGNAVFVITVIINAIFDISIHQMITSNTIFVITAISSTMFVITILNAMLVIAIHHITISNTMFIISVHLQQQQHQA